jgi:hypothetical protein
MINADGSGYTAIHRKSGNQVPMSNGTGISGHCTEFASDGSIQDAGVSCGEVNGTSGTIATEGMPALSSAGRTPPQIE